MESITINGNQTSSKGHTLLPCPFCGNENPSDGFPFIMCDKCGTFGPYSKDGRSGVELWNQRLEVQRAVDHARDVLAQPEPAPAADGEVAKLVAALRIIAVEADRACQLSDADVITCAANLLERQAAAAPVARLPEDAQVIEPANRAILVPVPAPIPVSERLPEKAEMTDDDAVWVEYPGGEYPLGDTGDYDWEPHKWILSPIAKFTIRENRRWLPAHALPHPFS